VGESRIEGASQRLALSPTGGESLERRGNLTL